MAESHTEVPGHTDRDLLTLSVGAPATGGTFVARHEGRVVFVRGSAPGETVVARIVDPPQNRERARFWRAETVEVLEAGPDRVQSAWPEAGPGGVGGGEWAHIALPAQRRFATEVLRDLLTRAGVTTVDPNELTVEPATAEDDGLTWRTRVRFAVDRTGRVGMRGWRSHDVKDVGDNPLAAPEIRAARIQDWRAPAGCEAIDVSAPNASPLSIVLIGTDIRPEQVRIPDPWGTTNVAVRTSTGLVPVRGDTTITEEVGEHRYRLSATGFWQVHRQAPSLLSEVVDQDLHIQPGETIWDLYGGAGLFAPSAAKRTGESGHVTTVEGDRTASRFARSNLSPYPHARAVTADVLTWLRSHRHRADAVVLDPPRAGAGTAVMDQLTAKTRRRIVYVSCDPATLARDLARAERNHWRIADLRAFDLFPHTHHVETIAVLEPTSPA